MRSTQSEAGLGGIRSFPQDLMRPMVEDPELASSLAEEMRSFQTFQNAIEKFRNEQNRLHEHAAFLLQQLDESKSSTRAATDENPNSKSSDFEGGVAGAFGTDPFLLNQSQRPEQGQTVVRSVVPGHDHIGSFRPAQREGNSQMSADNFGSVLQTQAGSSYRRRSVPHQRVRVSGAKTEGAVEDAVLRMQEQLVDIQETSGEQAKEAIRTMLNSVKLPPAQAVAVAKKLKKMLKGARRRRIPLEALEEASGERDSASSPRRGPLSAAAPLQPGEPRTPRTENADSAVYFNIADSDQEKEKEGAEKGSSKRPVSPHQPATMEAEVEIDMEAGMGGPPGGFVGSQSRQPSEREEVDMFDLIPDSANCRRVFRSVPVTEGITSGRGEGEDDLGDSQEDNGILSGDSLIYSPFLTHQGTVQEAPERRSNASPTGSRPHTSSSRHGSRPLSPQPMHVPPQTRPFASLSNGETEGAVTETVSGSTGVTQSAVPPPTSTHLTVPLDRAAPVRPPVSAPSPIPPNSARKMPTPTPTGAVCLPRKPSEDDRPPSVAPTTPFFTPRESLSRAMSRDVTPMRSLQYPNASPRGPLPPHRQPSHPQPHPGSSTRLSPGRAPSGPIDPEDQWEGWRAVPAGGGRLFYHNIVTKESVWLPPRALETGVLGEWHRQKMPSASGTAKAMGWYNRTLDVWVRCEENPRTCVDVFRAALDGNIAFLQLYAEVGGDICVPDIEGRRPLHYAAAGGHLDSGLYLMSLLQGRHTQRLKRGKKADCPLNKPDMSQTTALMYAARHGNAAFCRALLAMGASVSARRSDGTTALHEAAAMGQFACASVLVEAGGDPALPDGFGRVPADLAALRGSEDCVKLLSVPKTLQQAAEKLTSGEAPPANAATSLLPKETEIPPGMPQAPAQIEMTHSTV